MTTLIPSEIVLGGPPLHEYVSRGSDNNHVIKVLNNTHFIVIVINPTHFVVIEIEAPVNEIFFVRDSLS